jgi:hypothetical protein
VVYLPSGALATQDIVSLKGRQASGTMRGKRTRGRDGVYVLRLREAPGCSEKREERWGTM